MGGLSSEVEQSGAHVIPTLARGTEHGGLESILEAISDGITVQDPTGALVFANAAAARLCGFASAAELIAATPAQLFAPFEMFDEQGHTFDAARLPGRLVLASGLPASAVLRIRERATGRDWWTALRATPIRDAAGNVQFAVNIWHDITATRRREEHDRYLSAVTATLSASLGYDDMLRSLAAALVPGLGDWCSIHMLEGAELRNVAVAHIDPARVALARDYARDYPPDPAQARGVWNVVRTGNAELYADLSDEVLAHGARDAAHLATLRAVGMRSVIVAPIRIRDRVEGTLTLVAAESRRSFDAVDVALVEELGRRAGAAIDNTLAYERERHARRRLEIVARAGAELSVTLDYDATLDSIVRVVFPDLADFAFFDLVEGAEVRRIAAAHEDPDADALIKATSWARSTRQDKNLCALSSGASGFHPYIDEAWRRDVAGGPEHLELLQRLALGSMITVPLRAHGELLGSLTVCFGKSGRHHGPDDVHLVEELARRAGIAVTQSRLFLAARESARTAEEANRIKDEFLATVSHELRTPLNAVLGWSFLLQGRVADPWVAKGVDVIHRNAQAQAKIIDDILDVSRIINGKLRLDLRSVDLAAVVGNAMDVVRAAADAKRIALQFEPPAGAHELVADPERLQQVVWNLLSNAIRFTEPEGAVTVGIARDDSSVRLAVTDSGRGIEPAFLPYVFDRFRQADASTTRRVGGLGLGLAIVRHLTELHGGRVEARSEGVGKGSTFEITLPLRALSIADAETAQRTTASAVEPADGPASLRGLRVLVVDDEPDARDLLEALLEAQGVQVRKAASALEALAAFDDSPPQLVLTDIGMADVDGYGLAKRIRARAPASGGQVPLVAVTAYAREEDRRKALASGFDAHIGKPVDPQRLLTLVAELHRTAQAKRA